MLSFTPRRDASMTPDDILDQLETAPIRYSDNVRPAYVPSTISAFIAGIADDCDPEAEQAAAIIDLMARAEAVASRMTKPEVGELAVKLGLAMHRSVRR
jgi:hypothetical protein